MFTAPRQTRKARKRNLGAAPQFVVPERGELSSGGEYVQVGVKIESEANARILTRGARMAMFGRAKRLKSTTDTALSGMRPPPVPCVVRLVRIGSRKLDDDNLRRAFKHVRDRVAAWLGIDDRDQRVYFAYGQTTMGRFAYGMRIEWWPADQARVDNLRRASGEVIA